MSSGRNMVVTSFGDAVLVSYGRRHAKTLRHDGNGNFVSHDGRLVPQFDPGRPWPAEAVRLSTGHLAVGPSTRVPIRQRASAPPRRHADHPIVVHIPCDAYTFGG